MRIAPATFYAPNVPLTGTYPGPIVRLGPTFTGSFNSNPVNIESAERWNFLAFTSGSVTGTLSVQVSNDPGLPPTFTFPVAQNIQNWATLSTSQQVMAANTTTYDFAFDGNSYIWARLVFGAAVGSTGSMLWNSNTQGPRF